MTRRRPPPHGDNRAEWDDAEDHADARRDVLRDVLRDDAGYGILATCPRCHQPFRHFNPARNPAQPCATCTNPTEGEP